MKYNEKHKTVENTKIDLSYVQKLRENGVGYTTIYGDDSSNLRDVYEREVLLEFHSEDAPKEFRDWWYEKGQKMFTEYYKRNK